MVENLRDHGYRLGLLSVHAKEWIEHCEPVSKPKPEAFLHIVDRMGASPETCSFTDDSKVNVDAATALGLTGIVFTDASALDVQIGKLLPDYRQPARSKPVRPFVPRLGMRESPGLPKSRTAGL
ncbi:MAG: HAD-IA family hydrolase [Xanthobacteraceae bacterium]|nr:HAD-IA family hydrolase [Xanthobacteraceae bacterium]